MKKKKPKIGFLIPRLGITDRGAEVFVYDLARRLIEDFDVIIWARNSKTKSSLIEDLIKSGVIVKKISCISEQHLIAQIPYSFSFLRKTLDKFHLNPSEIEMLTFSLFSLPHLLFNSYDILFPQNGIWGAVICRIVRFIKKTPFIYASGGGKEPPVVRQKPSLYIAHTPEIRNWIKSYRNDVHVKLIPYGVDMDIFFSKAKPLYLNLNPPIYLCVSALIPAKRINLAIQAVAKLQKGSLLVVGKGLLEKELKELGKKLLGGRFLLQAYPHRLTPRVYTACDVFTLPSIDEPFGIVYLEAMASGLPVVAPNDSSRKYIIGDAGILCDTQNLQEYSEALEKAAALDFGERPRQQALKFNWERVGKTYKKAFMDILRR